jgi:translation initiation factor IF-3
VHSKSPYKKRDRIVVNQLIRAPQLRVISETGEQLGILTKEEAFEQAKIADKDLVLIAANANPPIAKIIELAKFKYQQQQKEADSRKKAKAQDIKEVRFTPFMGDGDFAARLNKVVQFLKKGDKVRLSLQFKGRAITKKEFGYSIFGRVIEATSEFSTVELEPKLMGKKLMAQLMPMKNKPAPKAATE